MDALALIVGRSAHVDDHQPSRQRANSADRAPRTIGPAARDAAPLVQALAAELNVRTEKVLAERARTVRRSGEWRISGPPSAPRPTAAGSAAMRGGTPSIDPAGDARRERDEASPPDSIASIAP